MGPKLAFAVCTGRVHHRMVELSRARTVYDYNSKGRENNPVFRFRTAGGPSAIQETHRLQSRQRERGGQASARNNTGDQEMIYVAAVVWAGREARLCGGYLQRLNAGTGTAGESRRSTEG